MPRSPAASPPATIADAPATKPRPAPDSGAMGLAVADAGVLLLFLGLTFLLGVFPQHDTDYWWHLRTGDLIRSTGKLPTTDLYTFGAAGSPWIDLHWGFQVALSWLYARGGVNATIFAKCVVTTVAVGLLITARRRTWSLWVMCLAWIPALLVLSGRMYVRPETATLLYLCLDLAILTRIDRRPKLAWLLPIVQVFWVNTQGLFVFGPVVLMMALIDAALRRGAFSSDRRSWWKTVLSASLATGLACLVNPYGIFGALYPLQLVGTMTSPVFADILELQSIPDFIRKNGIESVPLQLHLITMALGALSFLIPLLWTLRERVVRSEDAELAKPSRKKSRKKAEEEPSWRLSAFRILLFVAFSLLSLKATRNSHQFAAVVGAVTAWNFGEWAAAVSRKRAIAGLKADRTAVPLIPRLAAVFVLAGMVVLVGSGGFYAIAGEGRAVGWGEAPLWFAHDAVKFAGSEGMPEKFLTYHNGVAGLFEYHNGPTQKVFADARLEVVGPEVYAADKAIAKSIASQRAGWAERIEALATPSPGMLIDHVQPATTDLAVALLGSPVWRCVYYDALASVYLPANSSAKFKAIDFAARHFGRDHTSDPSGSPALALATRDLTLQARSLIARGTNSRAAQTMTLLGLGYARRALAFDPSLAKMWRYLGILETLRLNRSAEEEEGRFRRPLDPITDTSYFRATHDLEQAVHLASDDFEGLIYLFDLYATRGMDEAAHATAAKLLALSRTPERVLILRGLTPRIARAQASMQKPPVTRWANAGELDRVVANLLAEGRAETAADLLSNAYPPKERTWDQADRIATLRLHLGRPDLAIAAWSDLAKVPRPALRDARLALATMVVGDYETARTLYRKAIAEEPGLFEAHYGLAILERDAGDASAAFQAATSAEASAGTSAAKSAASAIAGLVRPYATSPTK